MQNEEVRKLFNQLVAKPVLTPKALEATLVQGNTTLKALEYYDDKLQSLYNKLLHDEDLKNTSLYTLVLELGDQLVMNYTEDSKRLYQGPQVPKASLPNYEKEIDELLVKLCKQEVDLLSGIGVIVDKISRSLESGTWYSDDTLTITESIELVKNQLTELESTTRDLWVKKALIHYTSK